jgi:hypothetical protein
MIRSKGEKKVVATSMASTQDFATQQKQVEKVMEEYKDIFTSPNGVHLPDIPYGVRLPDKDIFLKPMG